MSFSPLLDNERRNNPWKGQLRSSKGFTLATMSMALFTDELLFSFMVPLLPYIFEQRLGVQASRVQAYTSLFLTEGALVAIITSPLIGHVADRAKSKKVLLLGLLMLTLVSVGGLAVTKSCQMIVAGLFIGRFFQCFTSNGLWIVGVATMVESVGSEHMGKIAGLTSTLTAAGTCTGPLLAGFLFGLGGYWPAWVGPAVFLAVDILMRILLIDRPKAPRERSGDESELVAEASPLLDAQPVPVEEETGWRFYARLFRQPRFATGIICYSVYALYIASFQATIPLHSWDAFRWEVFPVGLLLAAVQGPGMALAPLIGYWKDRWGSRIPTTIAFFSMAPFFLLSGAAGDERFPWFAGGNKGKVTYICSLATAGCLMSLLSGVGAMEATEAVDKLEESHPGIFGKYGGYSRAVAITSMSWTMGLMVGPVLGGFMVERFGYFELQCVQGGGGFHGELTGRCLPPCRRCHCTPDHGC
ncbi:MFS general substrate transporter [Aspergillus campestris IBT 28561]|uniref:MFS general substrate transporter n=1 Tax=Aspergillus campestris (strain IBT 28561) TaxID=1392248 RepID=A0A2I1D482_ASPC2|nr:MFS general substrate transporter [Aspergillus campestris IBT 28561]PKY04684.1 MFS general substrate transporter [Aspergillus campestris IBT 28561]